MKKTIERILKRPGSYNMVGDGFRVYNYFPGGYPVRERVSPFLMMDFNPEFNFGPSEKPLGVGAHPHKGFETVTIAYKGRVAHHDSTGNHGVIYPGDVQWMTAGAGILHKEYHEEQFSKTGGPFEMVQLWVNLPKAHKLAPPGYQALSASQMGVYALNNNGGQVNVVAGNCNGVRGPAKTFTEINLFDIRLNEKGELAVPVPSSHNTLLLVISGRVKINGQEAGQHDFVLFSNEGTDIEMTALEESMVLLLSGTPIVEPVAQYGPFVMNTQREIYEAIEEFNSGKFGFLD